MTGSEEPVVVRNLRLRYPETGRVVLKGVDLELRRGEVTLLLGPSGAGKSSLALTLNGLIPHLMEGEIRGEVLVNGRSTQEAGVPWLTSQVGMVFQDPESQLAALTVEDEVAFGMENLLVPPGEMPERMKEALRRVGMEGTEQRSTEALSGGQKQRLVLASTLAMGVSVLVFDEPTANLDPAGSSDFFALLAKLKGEGATILIIEHKLDELVEQVDRVVVLDREGKVAASGPPRDVIAGQAALLEQLGVWVPQVSELAEALQGCGVRLEPYPLTVDEASSTLERLLSSCIYPAALAVPAEPSLAKPSPNAPPKPPAAEVRDLWYTYPDGTRALAGVDLRVEAGDFFAIVGPNGSGKSTLARHLVGLLGVQRGEVRVGGDPVRKLPERELRRRIGYVFQNPEHQFVTLSVYDELAFSLRAQKLPEAEVARRVEPLLAEFGLEEYRDSNPFSLSQGQKRRLSVATMLVLDPQVLILDEPTFGQDRSNTVQVMEQLRSLNRRGVTIIIITHDMKLVAEYARNAAVLVEGRVEFGGTVRALFEQPTLLRRADLNVPPLLELSRKLRASHPGFPLLAGVHQWKEAVCARFATCREAASSTR